MIMIRRNEELVETSVSGTLPNTNRTPTGPASNAGLDEDRNQAENMKIQLVPLG
jgi:hypothetical protein